MINVFINVTTPAFIPSVSQIISLAALSLAVTFNRLHNILTIILPNVIPKINGSINTIKCILGDCKADIDTCSNNIYAKDGSILEFIVNTSSLTDKARLHGDLSHLSEELNGKVISIKIYKEG